MLSKTIISLAAAAAALGAMPSQASQYYVVAPLQGAGKYLEVALLGTPLPEGAIGAPYSTSLENKLVLRNARQPDKSTAQWAVVAGQLPQGLALTGALIHGAPTEYGAKQIGVQVTYQGKTAQQVYELGVRLPLALATRTLEMGLTNNAYDVDLRSSLSAPAATGIDLGQAIWSLKAGSSLPRGMSLTSQGRITGTPTTAAQTSFTVQVTIDGNTAEQTYDLTVAQLQVALNVPTVPVARHSQPYLLDIAPFVQVQGDDAYDPANLRIEAVSPLPQGLSMDSTGKIRGAVTGGLVRETPVTVRATYKNTSATQQFDLSTRLTIAMQGDGYRAWNTNQYATDCNEYRNEPHSGLYEGSTGSGWYRIVPTANSGVLTVYCDMDRDGGGWTLLMKQAALDGSTLRGDTAHWTSGVVLNDTGASLNLNDGNFVSKAFSSMPADTFRLTAANELTSKIQSVPTTRTGLVAFSNANRTNLRDSNGQAGTFTYTDWYVHRTTYASSSWAITSSRFMMNHGQTYAAFTTGDVFCGVRWGWSVNENPLSAENSGSHDECGGLGAYGPAYMTNVMRVLSAWQPATLYLWAK